MDLEKKFEEVKGYIGQIEYLTHAIVLVFKAKEPV